MKKHKLFAALAPAAMLAAAMLFFSPTASAQTTTGGRPGQRPAPVRPAPVQTPVVTVDKNALEVELALKPEAEFREIIIKRLNALEAKNNALEAENKELKSQLSVMKLLLTGLDKAFASHTHRLNAAALKMVFKCEIPVGNCSVTSNIQSGVLYIQKGEDMNTTPPQP